MIGSAQSLITAVGAASPSASRGIEGICMTNEEMKAFWKHHLDVWRKSGATEMTKSPNGMDFIELMTIGRKTGEPRSVLLSSLRAGDGWLIIASNIGEPNDPAWWTNIKAAGNRLRIRIAGGQVLNVAAVELEGAERAAEWARVCQTEPSYAAYEQKTSRHIPVIHLRPLT
jgi:deazaflavin-dependent oxidoreductase (nitroreductase family)